MCIRGDNNRLTRIRIIRKRRQGWLLIRTANNMTRIVHQTEILKVKP